MQVDQAVDTDSQINGCNTETIKDDLGKPE